MIDTIYLVAYFRPSDPSHERAVRFLEDLEDDVFVSQAALIEFDLLMKTRGMTLKERLKALALLDVLIDGRLILLTPADLAAAALLSDRYGLDYFDSLIAAQCLLRDAEPLTTDREMIEVVQDEGIKQEVLRAISI